MKKNLSIITFLLVSLQSLVAQNNYYCVDNVKYYWQEDTSSVNIIISNINNFDIIVENVLDFFLTKQIL